MTDNTFMKCELGSLRTENLERCILTERDASSRSAPSLDFQLDGWPMRASFGKSYLTIYAINAFADMAKDDPAAFVVGKPASLGRIPYAGLALFDKADREAMSVEKAQKLLIDTCRYCFGTEAKERYELIADFCAWISHLTEKQWHVELCALDDRRTTGWELVSQNVSLRPESPWNYRGWLYRLGRQLLGLCNSSNGRFSQLRSISAGSDRVSGFSGHERLHLVDRLCTALDITPSEINEIAASIDRLAANSGQSFRFNDGNTLFLE